MLLLLPLPPRGKPWSTLHTTPRHGERTELFCSPHVPWAWKEMAEGLLGKSLLPLLLRQAPSMVRSPFTWQITGTARAGERAHACVQAGKQAEEEV